MALPIEIPKLLGTVVDRVAPAVVSIGRRHRGSGVVIDPGRVLTNAHNVRGDEVTVTFVGGRSERGRVSGIDIDGDLAVVAADTGDAPPLVWASGEAAIGSLVFGVAATAGGGTRA